MTENFLNIPHTEGYFELEDYDLFYRSFGTGDTAMIVLHGGPVATATSSHRWGNTGVTT